ncbi:alkylated DNA repair protein [Tsukamurella pulmonis]|uniref:alpha-ketoglutarate-dependent dioxygenase AlkB n=1 Tax=Tsukamurella pulmonis TaxID=47312 RepID=UPI001EDD0CB2|nr:alpha-ketoglutarate-dependent dioxygenase AlkB [Tsukamurella pulmonis]BDD81042.1 alkylated DNA repair protein [Tsukamurella pulmonis]
MQDSLFDDAVPLAPHRRELTDGAWLDVRAGWQPDADALFAALSRDVPWVEERRRMYERTLPVPRLLRHYDTGAPLPHPELARTRDRLTELYWDELREPFTSVGLCLYRDGGDSVAWHGDTIGRGATHDTIVAIVSLGATRPFLLRPQGGGASTKLSIGHGDLLAMGGSAQRTWEHAVPKVPHAGPRISIQFRVAGVR